MEMEENKQNNWQLLYVSTLSSPNKLHLKFLYIWVMFVKENNIYEHSGNSLSLDKIGTGTQWTSAHQAVGMAVNELSEICCHTHRTASEQIK
jgi:hypothetical protein